MTSWDEDLILRLVYLYRNTKFKIVIWQVVAELCIRSEMSHFYCFKHGMWQTAWYVSMSEWWDLYSATLPTLRLLISTIHKNLRINRVPYKFPLFLKWVVALWSYVTFLCLAQKKMAASRYAQTSADKREKTFKFK